MHKERFLLFKFLLQNIEILFTKGVFLTADQG